MFIRDIFQFTASIPENTQTILDCYHDWQLVALSYFLAVLTAGTALAMVERVITVSNWRPRLMWELLGGVSMGGGIWAMHFMAMEAFRAPVPIEYDLLLTIMSMLVAMFFCTVGLALYGENQSLVGSLGASALLGTGIVFMHYIGMAAMVMPASLYYELPLFVTSIVIAVGAFLTALMISKMFVRGLMPNPVVMRVICSAIMGGAITGMHFTAMQGTVLVIQDTVIHSGVTIASSTHLILAIACITVIILVLSVIAGEVHRRLQQNERHLVQVNELVSQLEGAKLSLEKLAYRDPVTDLGNRRLLNESLDQIITQNVNEDDRFSLLFMDVDNFKRVNDSLGHASGDQLLRSIAKRLLACLRPTDIIARFGGDEFVIILQEESPFELENVTLRVLKAMARPFVVQNQTISVTLSMGIAQYPLHGATAAEIIRNADIALYRAKELGKNRYSLFNSEMHHHVNKVLQLENDLRKAIEKEKIDVYYQPVVDAKDHKIVQFEALARWKRNGSFVSPEEFITIAEANDLIIQLGFLVLRKLLRDISRLNALSYSHIKFSVNLSPIQFRDKILVETIELLLAENPVNPEQLEVEITESSIIENIDATVEQLKKLQALGISTSIDDFGTGYSSLSYLKKLPIDKIKIDRSFVTSIPHDPDDVAINEAVLVMAQRLNLRVVAEGIETPEQAEFYRRNHCDLLQGYLFSRAVPIDEALILLKGEADQAIEAVEL